MKRTRRHSMGSCHNCGAPLNHRRVKQDFWIKEKLVVVENVPAAVCGQCGERIVNATTARRVLTMLSDPQFLSAAPTISVPRVRYKLTCG